MTKSGYPIKGAVLRVSAASASLICAGAAVVALQTGQAAHAPAIEAVAGPDPVVASAPDLTEARRALAHAAAERVAPETSLAALPALDLSAAFGAEISGAPSDATPTSRRPPGPSPRPDAEPGVPLEPEAAPVTVSERWAWPRAPRDSDGPDPAPDLLAPVRVHGL